MAESPNACDRAIEILQRTHDGEDLAPHHLSLLQSAVNGFLTNAGEAAFEDLYRQALKGYVKPWLCGVEHLTLDHQGYVYWKGKIVEHYTVRSMSAQHLQAVARELGERCQHLESIGVEPDINTVIWCWEKYAPKA